jgi:hypothetical protein
MRLLVKTCTVAFCAVLILALAAGCGAGGNGTTSVESTTPGVTGENYPNSDTGTFVDGEEGKTGEEKQVAEEALSHAREANTGSTFKVTEVQLVEGWARVAVEEVGVPTEEAVGFGVYLRKGKDGE